MGLLSGDMVFPWYVLCLLFVVPFVDPRRPLRLLHLDLLVLLIVGLRPLRYFLVGGAVSTRVLVVTVIGLLYLLGRLVWSVFRPTAHREALVPLVPVAWLAIAIVVLAGFRVGYVVTDRASIIDVGEASVLGADRIVHGQDLYDGGLGRQVYGGDTYGPATYLAYVPFERIFPVGSGDRDFPVGSAHARARAAPVAAVTFDLLTMLGLFVLGRRLRPGRDGKVLGVALAYAWASYPYSFLVVRDALNDGLVALLVLAALLAIAYPLRRGALAALATATKFAPVVLAPLLVTGSGERRLRPILLFAGAFIAVSLAVFLPFVPDGGLHEMYDRTLGFQRTRTGWMAIWGRAPELDWLQTCVGVIVFATALLFAMIPRRRTLWQIAALAAALLIATQLAGTNWSPSYVVWFAPLALVGLFAAYDTGEPRPLAAGREHRYARRPARGVSVVERVLGIARRGADSERGVTAR